MVTWLVPPLLHNQLIGLAARLDAFAPSAGLEPPGGHYPGPVNGQYGHTVHHLLTSILGQHSGHFGYRGSAILQGAHLAHLVSARLSTTPTPPTPCSWPWKTPRAPSIPPLALSTMACSHFVVAHPFALGSYGLALTGLIAGLPPCEPSPTTPVTPRLAPTVALIERFLAPLSAPRANVGPVRNEPCHRPLHRFVYLRLYWSPTLLQPALPPRRTFCPPCFDRAPRPTTVRCTRR